MRLLRSGFFILITLSLACQSQNDRLLNYSLELAGPNKEELQKVLDYYTDSAEKYQAARFLIENMPGHYSYKGSSIDDYYQIAYELFHSELSPKEQRDSLLYLSTHQFYGIDSKIVQDVRIITADFLINNIEQAFQVWKNEEWAKHLSFEEFCEWILPYKCSELQSFDNWRNILSQSFSDSLRTQPFNDESYGSPFWAVNIVRNEIIETVQPFGLFTESGYPMLSAETMSNMTFGKCIDYVNLGVLTFRSLGIPALIEETPSWGRYRAGHSWYVIKNDNGEEMRSEWDISSCPGYPFFPYQRIPKIYRKTYSANRDRIDYFNNSTLKYPFSIFSQDVTSNNRNTSDICIKIEKGKNCVEPFAYIAVFNGHTKDWTIVDYSRVSKRQAVFSNMGRNIMYITLVYNGNTLVPASEPFILQKDGEIKFITFNKGKKEAIHITRKYYSSENVIATKERMIGAEIQAANDLSFSPSTSFFKIDSLSYPSLIPINDREEKYQYWRFLGANGSNCNISELAFYTKDTVLLNGEIICSNSSDKEKQKMAFDEDWITYYEDGNEDGGWIGLGFPEQSVVSFVRIIPRSDGNDIHPGDEYQLKYWNGNKWVIHKTMTANNNYLDFDSVPSGLLWLHDCTQGWDERPFTINNGEIEWW